MSQDILIRASEPEDLPDITELMNQPRAVWGTMQFPFTSLANRRKRFEATSANQTLLAAVIEGKVVGTLGLHRQEGRRAHVGVIGMAVHDAYAGRGAGTALMTAAVEQADLWLNIKRLELSVWTDNTRAIALYERFGFEREGLMRDYAFRDGAYADALSMARLRP
ncbi:MAG: GCN5-related N-acetyltransferase [Phenylobacterium sp.]|jgi:putative acetyltransferase|nr:GCN5-related N-acetyltransferase [Phenylobacterium sp.]